MGLDGVGEEGCCLPLFFFFFFLFFLFFFFFWWNGVEDEGGFDLRVCVCMVRV